MLELDDVTIRSLAVGPMDNRAYLLTEQSQGAQVLIDAAAEPDRLLALVRESSGSGRLDVVVTTHRHDDHIAALAAVVSATSAETAAGEEDADAIEAATGIVIDRRLAHGDTLAAGNVALDVISLRGHTPGSVALAYREPQQVSAPDAVAGRVHLFSGDSLFPGGVGNTWNDPDRFAQLYADVVGRVFERFGDDTIVYPGHGRATTLGDERPHLAEWHRRRW